MPSSDINALVQRALQSAQGGQWAQAEGLWRQVLSLDPNHPQALFSLGMHAFRAGRMEEALDWLQAAHSAAPGDPMLLVSIAHVLREGGNEEAELGALDGALARDPYCMPALLARGEHLERKGQKRQAAMHYGNVLKIVPEDSQWPPALRDRLSHARKVHEETGIALAEFFEREIGKRSAALSDFEAQRWREAGAILSGRSKPYLQDCNRLYIPRLPAIPFFDRSMFPWLPAVESLSLAIADEWRSIWGDERDDFRPYVAYEPGTPVNQWGELNHSKRWSSYFLWQHGAAVQAHLDSCPVTAEALAMTDAAEIPGQCPNAMFSVLLPHTRIPPHHGETNARTLVHLPLVVPPDCSYRVGFEWREWRVGEALVFDDTIEHEARNDSDQVRAVLIFEIWNPLLSPAERQMVKDVTVLEGQFQA